MMEEMYLSAGISREVFEFGQKIEQKLESRFKEFQENVEYNQIKVVRAMQKCKVSEACFVRRQAMAIMI